MKIKLLHNRDIDLPRWDNIILGASNSRVYAESWYLDIIHPDWMGIIYNDYEYVMPVIVSRKWGISYLFQPTYAQQHGIFPTSTPKITFEILESLQKYYSYFNLSLNALNVDVAYRYQVEERKNYILSLQLQVEDIWQGYNSHTKRYVKKAIRSCNVSKHVNAGDYLQLKQEFGPKGLKSKNLAKLKLIILKAMEQNRGLIYGAYSHRNELIAAAFFIIEPKRITYLNSVSNSEGKETRAMYAIVNQFITEHAGQNYLLDFEGSNIEGIARFFEGFGAQPETYQHIRYNHLPWYLKLFKK